MAAANGKPPNPVVFFDLTLGGMVRQSLQISFCQSSFAVVECLPYFKFRDNVRERLRSLRKSSIEG